MSEWPAPVGEQALHGPAGEFVLRTEPHSEAHPMALLSQFLVAFGCACGRGAYYQVEADRHYTNEFVVLVGPTATGRKGSSWGHVRRLLADSDPAFSGCLAGGLSSGEGLIAQVRDPADEDDGQAPADKRRLVVEPEFAQTLKVLAREGNTLSAIVRQAWDGEPLQTIVRNDPLRATGASIGIVGHITRDELLRYLTATELANGFANRFLLIAVKRSKLLPFGGALDGARFAEIRDSVRLALRFAQATSPDHVRRRRPRALDRHLRAAVHGPSRTGRRRDRPRRGTHRPPGIDLRPARPLRTDPPRAPRSRARGLALQRRLRPLDLRRRARRPHRRRDLGRRQGTPRRADPHRGLRHVQPQQETPRDRTRPLRPGRRRATTPRNPPTATRPIRELWIPVLTPAT